jgi:hypothetical protein
VSRKHPDRYVMRSAGSVIAFWVVAAALVVVVGIPLVGANWPVLSFLFAPSLFLAWLFWIVLYRPSVRYDQTQAVIVNIGRRHVLPWGHVTNIHQGINLIFELDAGKSIQAWGVPAPRRPGIIGSAIDRRTRPSTDLHHDAELLDSIRRSITPTSDPVVSTWEFVPLIIGLVLAIAVAVEFIIGV